MNDGTDNGLGCVLPLPPAPDGIELRHLRSFVAVAEELNFGRAAARLFLSQPALSRQIRGLERLVGCDLLRRSTHSIELTLAGEALLDRARIVLRGVDDAVTAAQAVSGEMAGRLARLWEPVDRSIADADLLTLRNATEALHAQYAPPANVTVRPVNTGGVASLVVTPEADPPATVLLVHGGLYVTGSAFGYRHLAGALAVAADGGVVVPEYRLAPEHPFPAAIEDVVRAYEWMLDAGTDPDTITVAGDSAGAGLVLALALSLKSGGLPQPGGLALLSPGIDLSLDAIADLPMPTEPQPALTVEQLKNLFGAYLDGHSLDDPLVSPLKADLNGLPPMLIQGATDDVLVQDAHRLADHARNCGVNVRFELYPVATHDFHIFWSFLPDAADAIQHAGHFARDVRATAGMAEPTTGADAR